MITTILQGGLGNQMFQYAAGFNLAKKSGSDLLLDTVFLDDRLPRKQVTRYVYSLDAFGIKKRPTFLSRCASALPIPGLWLYADIIQMKLRHKLRSQKMITEGNWTNKSLNKATLFGYFQGERYFTDSIEDIRSVFDFKNKMEGEAAVFAKEIQESDAVSLHVRRGDYVNFKNNEKLFGKTNTLYYEEAVDYITERVKNPIFFVFSNDIEWCRQNIKLKFPVTYITPSSAGPKDLFHMQLMSLCKHNIITNSTFSWWGAWLNKNKGKIVIAPKQWFQNSPKDFKDPVPSLWVRL